MVDGIGKERVARVKDLLRALPSGLATRTTCPRKGQLRKRGDRLLPRFVSRERFRSQRLPMP